MPTTATKPTAPAVGTLVTYHGSLTAQHGTWTFAGECLCPRDECADAGVRYVLTRPGYNHGLTCVGPSSFTPTTTR